MSHSRHRKSSDGPPDAGTSFSDPFPRPRRRTYLLIVLMFAVAVTVTAAHWPVLSAGALAFDDRQYLTDNQLVRNPGWASAGRFFREIFEPSTVAGYYQPLAMVSLMIDYAAGGRPEHLLPFHRTSLALHVINTSLVILLLNALFGQPWTAAMVGLLFGLHPMTVESIAWVADRKTLLATVFALGSLLSYVHFTRREGRRWVAYSLCLLLYALALISKPTTTLLPVAFMSLDFWPLRRLSRRAIFEKTPFFVVAGVSSIITMISQGRSTGIRSPALGTANTILLGFCHNVVFYLRRMVWPTDLTPLVLPPEPMSVANPAVLVGVIGTILLLVMLTITLRWTRAALTGWLIFMVLILPTMSGIQFTIAMASDKYAYLPSFGLLLVIAGLLARLWPRTHDHRIQVRHIGVVLLVCGLGAAECVGTRRALANWRTSEGLYRHMLACAPRAAVAHNDLGLIFAAQGRRDEAIREYEAALQAEPRYALALNNLGLELAARGDLDGAISRYTQALQVNPRYVAAYNNMGLALQSKARVDDAMAQYRGAIKINPEFAPAHYNLAMALESQGRTEEAIAQFRETVRIACYSAEAQNALASVLVMTGRTGEALPCLNQALALRPDWAEPMNNLAWILATSPDAAVRNGLRAVRLAERTAELIGRHNPRALDTLAAAYAEAGHLDQATATAQEALALASAAGEVELAEVIQTHLQRYSSGQPWREATGVAGTMKNP
jgi:protein O-mannosyl-transferase